MSEFMVTNGVEPGGDRVDVEIREGRIDRIVPAGTGNSEAFDPERRFDADGRLLTPSFVEVHTHLDSALTAGVAGWNESGTLAESFDLWEEIRERTTADAVRDRARTAVEWMAAHGVTRIRSHLAIEEPAVVDAMVALREELAPLIDLQLVAFPHAFVADEAKHDRFEAVIERADAVGGMPHGEPTRERGVAHVETIVDLADRHGLPLDVHVDETDDPNSRFTEVLAAKARGRGIGERTTASHATAMHSYPNAHAEKVVRLLADAGVSVVTNPLANAVLQGRSDDYPRRRGHTRIEELRAAGVTVGIGQDDLADTVYAYGDGDPLTAAFVLLHFAHMNTHAHVADLWEMLLAANREIYGLDADEHGLAEGAVGSLVVHDAVDEYDALRTRLPRPLVLAAGEPIARSERQSVVDLGAGPHDVDLSYSPD